MKPHRIWILIANSSYAEIFEVKEDGAHFIERYEHPESRKRTGELVTDKPGHTFESANFARHKVAEEEQALHRHERDIFSHELMKIISRGKNEHRFDQFVMVAPPQFLGELRRVFKKHSLKPTSEVVKNFPSILSFKEKMQLIQKYLPRRLKQNEAF